MGRRGVDAEKRYFYRGWKIALHTLDQRQRNQCCGDEEETHERLHFNHNDTTKVSVAVAKCAGRTKPLCHLHLFSPALFCGRSKFKYPTQKTASRQPSIYASMAATPMPLSIMLSSFNIQCHCILFSHIYYSFFFLSL